MYYFEFCLGNTKHSDTGEKQAVNKIVHLQTLTSCIFSLFQLFFLNVSEFIYIYELRKDFLTQIVRLHSFSLIWPDTIYS